MSTQIPQFNCHLALGDLAHVEADCWNHVLREAASGNYINEGCLAAVLQPDQSELHLLLKEKLLQPGDHLIDELLEHGRHRWRETMASGRQGWVVQLRRVGRRRPTVLVGS